MFGPHLTPNLTSFSSLCKDYEYPLHSHSSHYQKNDRCPPPPQSLPERACEVPSCRSDSECERHKHCCYNGCIYACLESVQPPPGRAGPAGKLGEREREGLAEMGVVVVVVVPMCGGCGVGGLSES